MRFTRSQTAEYIAEQAATWTALAREAKLEDLAYLLEMVSLEAASRREAINSHPRKKDVPGDRIAVELAPRL